MKLKLLLLVSLFCGILSQNLALASETENFGLYGFYLGQSLTEAIKNAFERGWNFYLAGPDSKGSVTANSANKNQQVRDIVESYTKITPKIGNSPSAIFKEHPQNDYFLLDKSFNQEEFGEVAQFPTRYSFEKFNDQLRRLLFSRRDKPQLDDGIYIMRISTKNNIDILIHFYSKFNDDKEPYVFFMSFDGGNNDTVNAMIETLNNRYGHFKDVQTTLKNTQIIQWYKENGYAVLFPNLKILYFADKNLYDGWVKEKMKLIQEIESKNKADQTKGM